MSWAAILVLAAGTYVLKSSGVLLLGDRVLPPSVTRLAELLPAALLAALIAVNVAVLDEELVVDARLAGLVAAIVAVRLKASFLLVVLTACATTALVRAIS